jgi:P27 family predicted phage terminase small subunit
MTDSPVSIPDHLAVSSKRWLASVLEDAADAVTDTDLRLLLLAAEALDRAATARRQIGREGITYTDRFGAPRKHPAVGVEADARAAFARLCAQLGLDGGKEPESTEPYRGRNSRTYRQPRKGPRP